jgi:CRISPR-associated endonuclease/helicase Cas3
LELSKGPSVDQEAFEEEGAGAERRAFEGWRRTVLAEDGIPAWVRLALTVMGAGARILRVGELPLRLAWQPRRLPGSELRTLAGMPVFVPAEVPDAANTEDDHGTFASVSVLLARHISGVAGITQTLATAVGLPVEILDDLVLAARFHDVGKADPRFQLMLHGGDPVAHAVAGRLLAKSAVSMPDRAARARARERAGYPSGMRHEGASVALVSSSRELREKAHDWDLVLHLIASHHGWFRPFAAPVSDASAVQITVDLDGVSLSAPGNHELLRVDSGVADRFWQLVRRYGWWGLAWLETVLRLADHRQSRLEESDG